MCNTNRSCALISDLTINHHHLSDNTNRTSTPTVVLKHLILYNQFVRNKRLAQPRIIRVRNSASASDSASVSINNTSSNGDKSTPTTSNGNGGRSRKKTAPGSTASTSTRAEEFTFDIRRKIRDLLSYLVRCFPPLQQKKKKQFQTVHS